MLTKIIYALILFSMITTVLACSGAKERPHVYYRSVRGPSYWYGHGPYYRDRVVVVPPEGGGGGDLEAVQLPQEPPDMGMPKMDIEPFD